MLLLYVLVGAVVFVLTEAVYITLNGSRVPAPEIPRGTVVYGAGTDISVVVLGDSTSVAQGAPYEKGYAVAAAEFLARHGKYRVHLTNVGVSGARAADVAAKQASKAAQKRPDIAIVAVGANDVTHLTPASSYERSLTATVRQLRGANPSVKIIITGSPDMGAVPSFSVAHSADSRH